MVGHDDEGVVARSAAQQGGAHRHVGGQVEGLGGRPVDRRRQFLLGDLDDRQAERLLPGGQHPLVRDAVVVLDDHRAQGLVAVEDVTEGRLERCHVQVAGQAQGEGAVVGR
ncbi:hypothetical protein STREPTOSP366_66440 [Streptomyces variabilis]